MDISSLISMVNGFKESVEKKHRNLVKRKQKLDQYRGNVSRGITLQPDQAKAIQHYEEVRNNIALLAEVMENTNEFALSFNKQVKVCQNKFQAWSSNNLQEAFQQFFKYQKFFELLGNNSSVKEAVSQEISQQELDHLQKFLGQLTTCTVERKPRFISDLIAASPNPVRPKDKACTFKIIHDLSTKLMESTRVQCAIEGRPYVMPEPEILETTNSTTDNEDSSPSTESMTTTTNETSEPQTSPPNEESPVEEQQASGAAVARAFNFLHPSEVGQQPNGQEPITAANPQATTPINEENNTGDCINFDQTEVEKTGEIAGPWVNINIVPDGTNQQQTQQQSNQSHYHRGNRRAYPAEHNGQSHNNEFNNRAPYSGGRGRGGGRGSGRPSRGGRGFNNQFKAGAETSSGGGVGGADYQHHQRPPMQQKRAEVA